MKLGKRQELFMRLLPKLLEKAFELGFEVRGGSLFRDPRLHGERNRPDIMTWLEANHPEAFTDALLAGYKAYGSRLSLHKDKCAIDLNLRLQGGGMVWTTKAHRELGEYWETLHPMCRWGGRYNDGNHYELLEWRQT